jgi:hypothetical protein
MRIPTRGYRIFAECSLPTATSDVAPAELGAFLGWRSYTDSAPAELGTICGSCSYKDFAPTELVRERLVDHNAELTPTVDIIVDS